MPCARSHTHSCSAGKEIRVIRKPQPLNAHLMTFVSVCLYADGCTIACISVLFMCVCVSCRLPEKKKYYCSKRLRLKARESFLNLLLSTGNLTISMWQSINLTYQFKKSIICIFINASISLSCCCFNTCWITIFTSKFTLTLDLNNFIRKIVFFFIYCSEWAVPSAATVHKVNLKSNQK